MPIAHPHVAPSPWRSPWTIAMIRMCSVALAVVGLAGCAPALPIFLAAPADPLHPARPMAAGALTRDAVRHAVVEPDDWDKRNRSVAPKGGSHAP